MSRSRQAEDLQLRDPELAAADDWARGPGQGPLGSKSDWTTM